MNVAEAVVDSGQTFTTTKLPPITIPTGDRRHMFGIRTGIKVSFEEFKRREKEETEDALQQERKEGPSSDAEDVQEQEESGSRILRNRKQTRARKVSQQASQQRVPKRKKGRSKEE